VGMTHEQVNDARFTRKETRGILSLQRSREDHPFEPPGMPQSLCPFRECLNSGGQKDPKLPGHAWNMLSSP